AEGIGLENRQGSQIPRGFESLYLLHFFQKQQVVLKQPYIRKRINDIHENLMQIVSLLPSRGGAVR
ncbi:hypothetical protein ACQJ0Y_24305, partial [Peribacillus simplex]|uniref:hypothetical protein n=1 Tax=Peribacillus simplex TaxID=1478 RepID=UPI003CFB6D96